MTAGATGVGPLAESPAAAPDRREGARERIVAKIPAGYSPAAHFLIPGALGMGVLAASAWLARDVQPVEWLTIPVTLFLGVNVTVPVFDWIHGTLWSEERERERRERRGKPLPE